ncbi:MAG TPA: efflux RND transporter periplasmic adaptor subunit [Rudaea sp.]|uniref:efflux RND transporter periplasmic adaptor subunit n=1 Tax=Rudaea sp. TaxID=2136325 RepID=UPI002F952CA1
MNKSDLLNELRIDKAQRDDHRGGGSTWALIAAAVVVVLALLGAGAWFFTGSKALDIEVATAAAPSAGGGDTAVLQATGYVTARRQATVSAQITGTLTDVLIEEGDHVKEGQILAHLDSTAQQAQLAQAQAGARAQQALLTQYQAQLAQSRRDLTRAQDLVGRKLVSTQSVEVARTQVEMQSAQIDAQRRQVEFAEANVRGAQVQLDYCTVRAPFTGVITAKAAQVGEIVSPLSAGGGFTRTGVGTIVDMDSLEIEVDVTESYINRVQARQPAQAILDAYPDWKIPAHVIAIIPSADRGKATVKVRVAIEQKDERVLPDMGVRVSFMEEAQKANAAPPKGVLVPTSAIVQREGKSVVFAIDNDRARLKPVTPGQTYNDLRLVEGIGSGTKLVKQPQAEMADGAKVEIKTAAK